MAVRRVAVLADTHGNLTALQVVLADVDALGIREIVVAGDIVNFGASSDRVVDLLREHDAQMVRGNHEIELIVPYHLVSTGQAAADAVVALGGPSALFRGPRFAVARWVNQQLGPQRRAFLSQLPDLLLLDDHTVVCHGSLRGVRDGVHPTHTAEELRPKFADTSFTLAFIGHIHQPHVHVIPPRPGTNEPERRFVNAGSVGMNLDGDPRASYVVAEQDTTGTDGTWRVEIRRLAYDTAAAVREYDNGLRDVAPEHVAAFSRQILTGRHYFGPWVRLSQHLPDDELRPSLRRYLEENP
jgi:predicted phosphodiesterase